MREAYEMGKGFKPLFLYIVLGAMSKFVTFGVDLL